LKFSVRYIFTSDMSDADENKEAANAVPLSIYGGDL
jgi:hypothetical protein